MASVWVGNAPTECDLCHDAIDKVFFDAALPRHGGTWANICLACFTGAYAKLGVGKGQKYERQSDGRFYCVAGGRGQ